MAFKDVSEQILRGLDAKKLPHGGKLYTFPVSVSAATGIVLQRIHEKALQAKDGGEEAPPTSDDIFEGIPDDQTESLLDEILGDTREQLIKDRVPAPVVDHMRNTLVMWHMTGSREVAEKYWEDVAGPKAPTDRKRPAAKKAASSKSTARRTSASAKSTQKRASTSGTTSRKR